MVDNDDQAARIFCGPLGEVLPTIKKHQIGWLVSAINQDMMLETPAVLADDHHLKLAMNDISETRDGLVLPSDDHVSKLLDFLSKWDMRSPLMIHCWAGVSRSTAGTFIALCHLNENMNEEEIALKLREASPTASPNLKLVTLGDELLGRSGRMVEAVRLIGQGDMAFEGDVFSMAAKL